jgi:hypothetical protein
VPEHVARPPRLSMDSTLREARARRADVTASRVIDTHVIKWIGVLPQAAAGRLLDLPEPSMSGGQDAIDTTADVSVSERTSDPLENPRCERSRGKAEMHRTAHS